MVNKRSLIYLLIILINLQSWTKADDISDFQIEGISVGDSVLRHNSLDYVEKMLTDKNTFFYRDNIFAVIGIKNESDIFDDVSATIKPKDKNFIVHMIEGRIFFPNNFRKCKTKLNEISNDIQSIFPNKNFKIEEGTHSYDGKSPKYVKYFDISGGRVVIACINWSKKLEKTMRFTDELKLSITNDKFMKWINEEAYN